MSEFPKGPEDAVSDAWAALHQGADREEVDSPARFTLDRSAVLMRVRSVHGMQRRQVDPPTQYIEPSAHYGELDVRELPPAPTADPVAVGQRTRMRPYAHTRGRTRPDYELALETLVSTSDRGRRYLGATSVQHKRICDLCADARSIAEIAAYLRLPLNVVKVLVSDMDNLELVVLHQPGLSFGDRSSREFMARVLAGLRSL